MEFKIFSNIFICVSYKKIILLPVNNTHNTNNTNDNTICSDAKCNIAFCFNVVNIVIIY